jgi:hypothetical protein
VDARVDSRGNAEAPASLDRRRSVQPAKVTRQFDAQVTALETSIRETLADVFGPNSRSCGHSTRSNSCWISESRRCTEPEATASLRRAGRIGPNPIRRRVRGGLELFHLFRRGHSPRRGSIVHAAPPEHIKNNFQCKLRLQCPY